ncbi:MAG: peptidase S41 [Bacteroidetes bacterium]|nr:MAG: peptidase S41 [Bacteroidota bacterium]
MYKKGIYQLFFIILLLIGLINPTQVNAQISSEQVYKFNRVMDLISMFYVDTIKEQKLVEQAIISVLKDLDPHSIYITKDEVKEMNEPLFGSFDGIGITFNIFKDTVYVVRTYPGGPSEKAGLKAGDRIVSVENELIAGTGINSRMVKKLLLGKKGSKVNVSIKRKSNTKLIDYTIVRDKIPINSIVTAYKADEKIGYIKLTKFSATTIDEFEKAIKKLKKKDANNLILDLRDNGGGYLRTAIKVADQFLPTNKLIVYTQGTSSPRSNYFSTAKGNAEKSKLVILIDEGTASASEIVTGAMQDWDRGVVIGRRSFGKGLVQRPFHLMDGSMIRLTIARYYTPTGRLIQKSYADGYQNYSEDIENRFNNGELFSKDSIHFVDSLKFLTLDKNRLVFGGGGIMPDIFIAADTSSVPTFYRKLLRTGKLNDFLLKYVDSNRTILESEYTDFKKFKETFEVDNSILNELIKFAVIEEFHDPDSKEYILAHESETIDNNIYEQILEGNEEMLKHQLKALIARNIWGDKAFYEIFNQKDKTYLKAIAVLKNPLLYNSILGY